MSKQTLKAILALGALAAVLISIILARPAPTPTPGPVPPLACIPPPSPYYASSANVEIALTESIKVLKAQASPNVLDVIPKDARGLEMIGFLSCRAREQGLIGSAQELNEYTELLGRLHSGKAINPFVRHHGKLANLERHLRTTPDDTFSVLLNDPRGILARFDVDELAARDWQSWFKKFCARYSGCIACSPDGDAIKETVSLSATDRMNEIEQEGKKVVACSR